MDIKRLLWSWLRRLQHEGGKTGSGDDASRGSSNHGGSIVTVSRGGRTVAIGAGGIAAGAAAVAAVATVRGLGSITTVASGGRRLHASGGRTDGRSDGGETRSHGADSRANSRADRAAEVAGAGADSSDHGLAIGGDGGDETTGAAPVAAAASDGRGGGVGARGTAISSGGTRGRGDLDTSVAAKAQTSLDSALSVLVVAGSLDTVADALNELGVLAETVDVVGVAVFDLNGAVVGDHVLTALGSTAGNIAEALSGNDTSKGGNNGGSGLHFDRL